MNKETKKLITETRKLIEIHQRSIESLEALISKWEREQRNTLPTIKETEHSRERVGGIL